MGEGGAHPEIPDERDAIEAARHKALVIQTHLSPRDGGRRGEGDRGRSSRGRGKGGGHPQPHLNPPNANDPESTRARERPHIRAT